MSEKPVYFQEIVEDCSVITADIFVAIQNCSSAAEVEAIRVKTLGKNGNITTLSKKLSLIQSIEERKIAGQHINEAKQKINDVIAARAEALKLADINARLDKEWVDVTLPPRIQEQGFIHPVSKVLEEITALFAAQGFGVATGPEIEDDYHNFTALNFSENHPARQMHDTFFLRG